MAVLTKNNNMNTSIYIAKHAKVALRTLLLFFAVTATTSCNDFLDITPTGRIIAKTGKEYRELLTYEYKYFPSDRGMATLRSDEMTLMPGYTKELDYDTYFDLWRWNDDSPSVTTTYFGWRGYYHAIYISNYVIEHKAEITNASQEEVNQLVGESYMMRAYCHFLLANLYAAPYTHGDPVTTRGIPLQMDTDLNAVLRSSSLKDVYAQILSDIDKAEQHLNVKTWEAGFNYRFNTTSAQCLRARVCLYMGDWQGALTAAEAVIAAHPDLENLTSPGYKLPSRFDSKESIVALEQIMPSKYVLIGRPARSLIDMYRSGDLRRTAFYRRITSSAFDLLKGGDETFNCTFRSGEFYLTAAEAAMHLGQRSKALEHLSALMAKRYDAQTYATLLTENESMSDDELTAEILKERCRELAFEGHRWFDLRRTTMPSLTKTYDGTIYTLDSLDVRYTLRFPSEAREANSEIELMVQKPMGGQ